MIVPRFDIPGDTLRELEHAARAYMLKRFQMARREPDAAKRRSLNRSAERLRLFLDAVRPGRRR